MGSDNTVNIQKYLKPFFEWAHALNKREIVVAGKSVTISTVFTVDLKSAWQILD